MYLLYTDQCLKAQRASTKCQEVNIHGGRVSDYLDLALTFRLFLLSLLTLFFLHLFLMVNSSLKKRN